MIIARTTVCLILSLLFSTCDLLHAQSSGTTKMAKSCQDFVRSFYDWYGARAFATPGGWLETSLRGRPSSFGPALRRALEAYQDAPANTQAEIEKLDFDPFLNAQDTAESYVVENFRRRGASFLVDVYSLSSGKKNSKPDVTPELVFQNGRWLFVNFRYPNRNTAEGDNLLSILKSLGDYRQKHPK